MYKLPQDILRLIYEYDDTYKIQYDNCINEMNFVIPFNHVIDNMNIMNFYYNQYKIYCTINNERFCNDLYNPIMKINKFYKRFKESHHRKDSLKHINVKKHLKIYKSLR